MPWTIESSGGRECVYRADSDGNAIGEPLQCYDNTEDAQAYLAALEANVHHGKHWYHVEPEAVKAANGVVEGYLVRTTSPERRDLYTEWFSQNTDYVKGAYPVIGSPFLFEHGHDQSVGPIPIGRFIDVTWTDDNSVYAKAVNEFATNYRKWLDGLAQPDEWKQQQEEIARQYERILDEMFQEGILKFSSGSLPAGVKVGATGEILRWPIVEGSATTHPADPYDNTLIIESGKYVAQLRQREPIRGAPLYVVNYGGKKMGTKDKKPTGGGDAPEKMLEEQDFMEIRNMIQQEVPMMIRQALEAEGLVASEEDIDEAAAEAAAQVGEEEDEEMNGVRRFYDLPQEVQESIFDSAMDTVMKAVVDREQQQQALISRGRNAVRNARVKPPSASKGYNAGEPQTRRGQRRGQPPSANRGFGNVQNPIIKQVERDLDKAPFGAQLKAMFYQQRYGDQEYMRAFKDAVTERRLQSGEDDYDSYERAMKAQSSTIGPLGAWIGEPAVRETLIDQLRESTFLNKVGALTTQVSGNQAVERPRLTASPKAQWVGDRQSVQEDEYQVEMLTAYPKALAGLYAVPWAQLERLNTQDENILRNHLVTSLRLAIDEAALRGVGAVPNDAAPASTGGQPLGLLNALPSAQVTSLDTANPSPDDMRKVVAAVDARNVDLTDNAHWIYHKNMLHFFESLTDTRGQLLNRSQWTLGYDPVTTNQVQTNLGSGSNETRIYFGEWGFFENVMSEDIQIVLLTGDEYTKNLSIGVMAYTYCDFLIHHQEAFEIRTGAITS